MSQTPLSFEEAATKYKSKEISWREYIHQLFLHCTDQWRNDAKPLPPNKRLMQDDAFAHSVWLLQDRIRDVKDSTQLDQVFFTAEDGSAEQVAAKLDQLSQDDAAWLCTSLALHALRRRKADLLAFTFERTHALGLVEIPPAHAFRDAADKVRGYKDPAVYAVITKSWWYMHKISQKYKEKHPRRDEFPREDFPAWALGGSAKRS